MGAVIYMGISHPQSAYLVIASLMYIGKNSIEYFVFMFFSRLLKHLRSNINVKYVKLCIAAMLNICDYLRDKYFTSAVPCLQVITSQCTGIAFKC